MRKLNLTPEKPHKMAEDIVSLNELSRIYKKKIEIYVKRKSKDVNINTLNHIAEIYTESYLVSYQLRIRLSQIKIGTTGQKCRKNQTPLAKNSISTSPIQMSRIHFLLLKS
ncbi:hypothetical protein TCON_0393 [Astathelohania contejeani]|uniref:Uncharacterized protein n=1 Tax=Astathelohania contejeani TaxID=164912 RepID=A0ABQ7I1S9_9MICR|nr:hypothetical protein TCON_0393 [Thelohania contejeani]